MPMATTTYSMYYVIQMTSFEITFDVLMVLFMVSKKPYNHTCLTYGFQETFMVVIPGI